MSTTTNQPSSEYLAQDIGPTIIATASLLIILSTLFVGLRYYARHLAQTKFGIEDLIIPLAWLSEVGLCITGIGTSQSRSISKLLLKSSSHGSESEYWPPFRIYRLHRSRQACRTPQRHYDCRNHSSTGSSILKTRCLTSVSQGLHQQDYATDHMVDHLRSHRNMVLIHNCHHVPMSTVRVQLGQINTGRHLFRRHVLFREQQRTQHCHRYVSSGYRVTARQPYQMSYGNLALTINITNSSLA
jgi:hypothetical protein